MDPRVIAGVRAATSDPRYQATMYYACGAESGCEAIPQMGGGPGRGPWQMETTWEPEDRAMNPITAALDFFTKWPVRKCTDAQGDLWNTDPVKAAYTAARCAESNQSGLGAAYNAAQMKAGEAAMAAGLGNPSQPSQPSAPGICALPFVSNICAGASVVNGVTGGLAGNATAATLKAILGPLFDLFGSHQFWIRAVLVIGGLASIVIGLAGLTHIEAVPVPV